MSLMLIGCYKVNYKESLLEMLSLELSLSSYSSHSLGHLPHKSVNNKHLVSFNRVCQHALKPQHQH